MIKSELQKRLVNIIIKTLKFPYPQICIHSVSLDLLSLLEESGLIISNELSVYIVKAEDNLAILELEKLQTFIKE